MDDTWTEPATFSAGQVVDEDDMNEQVRDNMTYLKNRFVNFGVTSQTFSYKSKTPGELTDT